MRCGAIYYKGARIALDREISNHIYSGPLGALEKGLSKLTATQLCRLGFRVRVLVAFQDRQPGMA